MYLYVTYKIYYIKQIFIYLEIGKFIKIYQNKNNSKEVLQNKNPKEIPNFVILMKLINAFDFV